MKEKEDIFTPALKGKKIPILTLDNKWYHLFANIREEEEICALEKQLNDLLKRQGKLNTESRDIKKLKKKLMNEIVPMVDDLGNGNNSSLEKMIEDHKRLIEEAIEKLEAYEDELLELPGKIDQVNFQLMLATMDYCYETMQSNTVDIQEIAKWVANIRVELKKNLIRKQEKEIINHNIYSYMHDIFGAEVIELFDMKYNPEEQHPKPPQPKPPQPKAVQQTSTQSEEAAASVSAEGVGPIKNRQTKTEKNTQSGAEGKKTEGKDISQGNVKQT